MILGYVIDVQDNGYEMLSGINLNKCANFSDIYKLNLINENFKLTKKIKHISTTYDNFTIVSDKFKEFCLKEKYKGLEFVNLPKSPGFYWFKIKNVLKVDVIARKTQFLNFNKNCNGFEEIIGANPVCLKTKKCLQDAIFRSDICFGSGYRKSPIEIVGEITMEKMVATGFKEIYFEKILDEYDWQKKGLDPNHVNFP
jgi:hypothetical protein